MSADELEETLAGSGAADGGVVLVDVPAVVEEDLEYGDGLSDASLRGSYSDLGWG